MVKVPNGAMTFSKGMSTTLVPNVACPARPRLGWAAAWAIVAAGGAALLGVLATEVWPKRPEMGDRFLVPLASTVLLYSLRPRWRATPCLPARSGLVAVVIGAVAFAPAWYLLVRVGPRTLLLWWLAAALSLAAIGLLAAGQGWRRAGVVLFPLLFAFFALPTPDILQAWLLAKLKAMTTIGAAAVLPWLGVPAVRSGTGFTLTLPSGKLGVVDACSGALSLTSLLAVAVLTAYVRVAVRRDFTLLRAAALVVLTIPIVIVSNTVRVIATGILQEMLGPNAIVGLWHEVLGYVTILVGFGLIVAVSQKLAARAVAAGTVALASVPANVPVASAPAGRGWAALALLLPAAAVCIWAERFRDSQFELADLGSIAVALPGWEGKPLEVPPDVAEMLKCDQLVLREYEDHLGNRVEVYFMFWATPASTAHIHHPDVCWPSRGCTLAESHVLPVRYSADREPIGVSVRHYDTEDGKREVVFYWTQNGNAVLPDGRETAHGSEYAWVREMLSGQQPPERVSRLSVLLGADVPVGRPADEQARIAELSALIAAEVYRVCPWAAPP